MVATLHRSIAGLSPMHSSMPHGHAGSVASSTAREHAGIADDQVIMICVAMGFPDESFPANAVIPNRKSVDEATVFVGFDD
jgi:hypothetical protein